SSQYSQEKKSDSQTVMQTQTTTLSQPLMDVDNINISIQSTLDSIRIARCKATKKLSAFKDVLLFEREVVIAELSHDSELSMGSTESVRLSVGSMRDFTKYMCLVYKFLKPPFDFPISLPLMKDGTSEAVC
ncbi:E3 ubiquitin- protein ligase, partial [Datura stramonium]|nr:E3 ubiquitin- protein ligase [Datura stramonium]